MFYNTDSGCETSMRYLTLPTKVRRPDSSAGDIRNADEAVLQPFWGVKAEAAPAARSTSAEGRVSLIIFPLIAMCLLVKLITVQLGPRNTY